MSMMVDTSAVAVPSVELSEAAGEFLRLLADPTRRRVFLLLMRGETCNCEMKGLLGLPHNLISHHLRKLRRAGLARARRDATDKRWIYYSIDREALARVHAELALRFDPAEIGGRVPDCGPAARRCT
jgi:DNA-binding transcriptional ArsR family regulator